MNKDTLVRSFQRYLLLHLFLHLVTWPLFIVWGLPLAPLSILGNILFFPFLFAFLILSFIIFTASCVSLPIAYLHQPLEWLSMLWIKSTSWSWIDHNLSCPASSFPLLYSIPCIAITLLRLRISRMYKIMLFCLAFISIAALLHFQRKTTYHTIAYGNEKITITRDTKGLHITLPEKGRSPKDIDSWLTYRFMPEIYRHFGSCIIETLQIPKITRHTLHISKTLNERLTINHIICSKQVETVLKKERIRIPCTIISHLQQPHAPATSMPSFHASQVDH